MGLNTWATFYGSDSDSVAAGNVAMLESEVTPVLKALRSNGIDVVAIHHHMIGTQPASSSFITGERVMHRNWRVASEPPLMFSAKAQRVTRVSRVSEF